MLLIKSGKFIEANCDICGSDCMKEIYSPFDHDGDCDDNDIIKTFEGMKLNAEWGFCSKKDGEDWEAIVCESCVDKHLSKLIRFVKTPKL